MKKIQAPVVLMIYKRVNSLAQVIAILREVKPDKVYVIADGPKGPEEVQACSEARGVIEGIDWKCQVVKHYADSNLGLKKRFATGLSWLFAREDRAIILEDDCLPDVSFFRYCDELLAKYKDTDQVISISGNNFQDDVVTADSYYYSRYPHIWGWATWKRVWDQYDGDIADWPTRKRVGWPREITERFFITKYWRYIFDRLYHGKIRTWDYQLTYLSFAMRGINIIPAVNLVTNMGKDLDATNTKRVTHAIGRPTSAMSFPLKHPGKMSVLHNADSYVEETVFLNTVAKISLLVKSLFGLV